MPDEEQKRTNKERRAAAYRKIAEEDGRMGLRHARARDLSAAEWHVCLDGQILCDYEYDYGIYNTEFDASDPPSGSDWCPVCVKRALELSK